MEIFKMKRRSLSVLAVIAAFSVFAAAQGNTSTRPRIAPTPTPPVIHGETQRTGQGRAPVLQDRNLPPRSQSGSQPQPTIAGDDDVIKVETNLITLPVSVLDREGRFVSGLQQRDFRIFENGVEQKVDYFLSVEQPFTVVLMIDVSPSTAFKIDEIHDAAITFVDQLRENDRVMVLAFDERVRVLARPTGDKRLLRNAIRNAQFGDGTSLYEAVDHVLRRELSQIQGRKAVVLFTDGVDTTSRRATYESTVAEVEEIDALFYPIRYDTQRDGFGGGWGGRGPRGGGRSPRGGSGSIDDIIGIILGGGSFPQGGSGGRRGGGMSSGEYAVGQRYLELLAQNSGGRLFEADTVTDLRTSFAGIAEELRRQYSLGYYPERVGDVGERKQIRVRVNRPNLVVRAKSSYIVGQNSPRPTGS
jgi:Ca-activated chloride channel homolog